MLKDLLATAIKNPGDLRRQIALKKYEYLDVNYVNQKFSDTDITGDSFTLDLQKIDRLTEKDPDKKGDIALVFLVDKEFLSAFFTLLYSLEKTASFKGIPKVVLTIEDEIFHNADVNRLADEVIKIDLEHENELKKTTTHNKYKHFHRDFIPNITFLKFFAFKVTGYKKLLFLDADIICLNNADEILTIAQEADIAVCPTIDTSIYFSDGNLLESNELDRAYQEHFKISAGKMINSGVFFLNERFIGDHIFNILVYLAQNFEHPSDQNVIYRLIYLLKNSVDMKFLPFWHNVTRPTFDYLGEKVFARDYENIIFHHYSGHSGKPWEKSSEQSDYNFLDELWYSHFSEAIEYYGLTNEYYFDVYSTK